MRAITVEIPDGVTLDGIERGDAGPAVIFLHGITDSCRSFDLLLPRLPDRLRAVALTLRGHGASSKPEAGYGAREMAADVAAALDGLGIERAVVVGHSLGTLVAQRLAFDRPDLVVALALIGPFVAPCRNPAIAEIRAAFATLEDPIDSAFVRSWQEGASGPTVDRAFLELAIAESLRVPARVWKIASEALHQTDLTAATRAISAPVLLVQGEQDEMCRAETALLAGMLPQAGTVRVPGCGHAPHWEDPAAAADALVPFLERHAPAASPVAA